MDYLFFLYPLYSQARMSLISIFTFELVLQACGGTFNQSSGSFTSPNYPDTYPNGLTCDYVITATDNQQVTVIFDAFELEASVICRLDYVEVSRVQIECNVKFHLP